jgi:GDPmannose 4,6-dehydratase
MHPVSIYGIAKLAAHQICNMYRDAYGMFIVSSILFNHEGSRRGRTFVTQKISKYVADYHKTDDKSSFKPLQIGNLNARRDWGDAKDYMNAVYLMLLSNKPDNYVIATGETHSVREFIELAFNQVGTKIEWKGDGLDEVGVDTKTGQILVQVNPYYFRDIDIECLIGDASNAKEKLGWTPSVTFKKLVEYMVKEAIKN